MKKTELIKFLDVVEIFTMKDILNVFGIDHHTFRKYLGESKKVGKKRGINKNGRRYYSIEDISEIMNMNQHGVKILMMEHYRRRESTSSTQQLWIDVKKDLSQK